MTTEAQSSTVARRPTQEEDTRTRWGWVEPSVWTERMLTALDNGVKGGKWYSVCDKVWQPANLQAAWERVYANRGGSGVDGQTVHEYQKRWQQEINCLHDLLKAERYVPQPVRRVLIPKPGSRDKRPLGIPAVRDRVVQTAMRHVLEPIFERIFAEHSYGFRPGRSCKDALRRVNTLLADGYQWVVDADLKSYFDTIPHDRLMALVEEQVADGRMLALLRGYLQQGIMDGLKEWTPDGGTPQGAVISPLLANVYLNPLDHLVAKAGYSMVRYADDFVILCRTREEAEAALALVQRWVTEAGLTLHPDKTRIVHDTEGFDFLGYHFERGKHWPRKKSWTKFTDTLRTETRRANGRSLEAIIARLNPKLRGWYGYFKHSYWNVFPRLDGWLRKRLRAILNKRAGRSRWAHTHTDHIRWPNAFFDAHGLFSMTTAHAAECQSLYGLPVNWRAGCGKSARPVRREG